MMGYLKVYLIGLIWIVSLVLSIRGWYKIAIFFLAILLPDFLLATKPLS